MLSESLIICNCYPVSEMPTLSWDQGALLLSPEGYEDVSIGNQYGKTGIFHLNSLVLSQYLF